MPFDEWIKEYNQWIKAWHAEQSKWRDSHTNTYDGLTIMVETLGILCFFTLLIFPGYQINCVLKSYRLQLYNWNNKSSCVITAIYLLVTYLTIFTICKYVLMLLPRPRKEVVEHQQFLEKLVNQGSKLQTQIHSITELCAYNIKPQGTFDEDRGIVPLLKIKPAMAYTFNDSLPNEQRLNKYIETALLEIQAEQI